MLQSVMGFLSPDALATLDGTATRFRGSTGESVAERISSLDAAVQQAIVQRLAVTTAELSVSVCMACGASTTLQVPISACTGAESVLKRIKLQIEQQTGVSLRNQELYAAEEQDPPTPSFQLVLLDNGMVIESDTWSRHLCSNYNLRLVKSDVLVTGDSKSFPMLGSRACSSGLHTWTLRGEGNIFCMRLGVALSTIDLSSVSSNKYFRSRSCWGFTLSDRDMFFGGQHHEREAGPESFQSPFEATLRLDCSAGTLSAAVNGVDLGIICSTLPPDEPLHLAMSTYHNSSRLVLTSYRRTAQRLPMGMPPRPPGV